MLKKLKFKDFKIVKPVEVNTYFENIDDLERVINFSLEVIDGHTCLIVDTFSPNGDAMKTIIDKESNDFINLIFKANGRKKKSKAIFGNMRWVWYAKSYAILNKSIALNFFAIEKLLKNDEVIYFISNFQNHIKEKIKAEQEKPVMDILETLPFDELNKTQRKWAVATQKHNLKAGYSNVCYLSFLSKVKGTVVHRHFRCFWNKNIKDYELYEFGRDVMYNGRIYKFWSLKNSYCWLKGRGMYQQKNFQEGYLYTGNLKSVLKGTPFEKSGFYEFAMSSKGYTFPWENYLSASQKVPQLEKLSKVGLSNIASYVAMNYYYGSKNSYYSTYSSNYYYYYDKAYFDFSKQDLLGFLKIPNKNYLRLMIERDSCVRSDLVFMQKYPQYGVSVTESDFKELLQINFYNNFFDFKKVVGTSKKGCVSIHKILKYCKSKILSESQKEYYKDFEKNLSLYCDYIDFISRMNYDFKKSSNKYPKDLKLAHDQASELYEAIVKANNDKKFKTFYKALKSLHNVEIEGYIFKIPSCNDDFIKQGEKENICVGRGTYFTSMAERKDLIVFIENKQTQETATMEIDSEGKIVQLRGKHNHSVSSELKLVANHYERLAYRQLIFNGSTIEINKQAEQLETVSA